MRVAIVTVDGHFKVLREIPFPKVSIVNLDEFLKIVNSF